MADATIRVDADTRGAERAISSVTKALGALASAVAVKAIVQQFTAFERYRVVLNTYLGSQAKANLELGRLQKLANSLPQDLDDITRAFTLFTSRGLDTSTKALTAFSNIATANGKSLTQLGEAVADALTGEYERLKEFGIKVSKDNDKFVADIGEGQKIIASSSRELVQQLQALGEAGGKFGNAAANNADTLGQAFSNLRGAAFEASVTFGEAASGGLKDFANSITDAIRSNEQIVESLGRTAGVIARTLGNAITIVITYMNELKLAFIAFLALGIGKGITNIALAFTNLGKAAGYSLDNIKRMKAALARNFVGALLAAGFIIADMTGALDDFYKSIGLISETPFLDDLIERANNLSSELSGLKQASTEWFQTLDDARPVIKQLENIRAELETNISAHKLLLRDQDTESDNYKALTRDLNELEANYKRVTDALGRYAAATEILIEVTDKRSDAERAAATVIADIDKRIEGIEQTKLAIAGVTQAYRDGGIEANQFYLAMDQLTQQQLQASADLIDARRYEMRQLMDRYDLEKRLIAENERYRKIQIEKGLVAQGVGTKDAQELAAKQAEYEKSTAKEKTQYVIGQAGDALSKIGQYNRQAFEAAKALNIAEALMSTYTGVANALKLPFPLNLVIGGVVLASGLAQVAAIRSQQYSGRALGGPVMAGESYIVGERGPELFTPATSGGITRNNQLGGGPTNINFYIQTNDARGFDQLLAERKPMIINMVRSAQNDRGNMSNL